MAEKKEHLEGLLEIIKTLITQEDNKWFKEKLISLMPEIEGSNSNDIKRVIKLEPLTEIYQELIRTKSFLKYIDRKSWIEGFEFYKNITDSTLRMEMVKDYKEMIVAEKDADVIEFTRRVVMQIENAITATIQKLDAFKLIEADPKKYCEYNRTTGALRTNLHKGEYSFFFDNGSRRKLKDISLPTKVKFAQIYYGFTYSFDDFREMTTIRNKASHRGELSADEVELIKNVTSNFLIKKSSFLKVRDNIVTNLRVLNT